MENFNVFKGVSIPLTISEQLEFERLKYNAAIEMEKSPNIQLLIKHYYEQTAAQLLNPVTEVSAQANDYLLRAAQKTASLDVYRCLYNLAISSRDLLESVKQLQEAKQAEDELTQLNLLNQEG